MMKKRIGEILVENGFISVDQLNLALRIQKRENTPPLGILLILMNYISPEQLLKCLDQQNVSPRGMLLED
jgi:hypothetical protein